MAGAGWSRSRRGGDHVTPHGALGSAAVRPRCTAPDVMVRDIVLSHIADEMQLPSFQADGRLVSSSRRLAAERVPGLRRDQIEEVESRLAAARGQSTFDDLAANTREVAREL